MLAQFRQKAFIFVRRLENRLESASIIIFSLAFITKILGFLKLRLIANVFGVSRDLDIFWAGFVIPDLVFMLIIGGSVNAALIPTFVRLKKNNPKKLRQTFSVVFIGTIVLWLFLWGMLAILLKLASPVLMNLLLVGMKTGSHVGKAGLNYKYYLGYTKLFTNLTILMFAGSFFLALSSVIGAYLLSYKRFLINNLSPLLYNLGIILGIIIILVSHHVGVYWLAASMVLGSLFHFGVQFFYLLKVERFKLIFLFKDTYYIVKHKVKVILKEVKQIFYLALPRILGIGIEQLTVFFNTFWALLLGAGALTVFKYALALHFLPIQLVGNSISQAVFPSLNEYRDKKKKINGHFTKLFYKAFYMIFLLAGYFAVVMFVLKTPIVKVLLGGQRFTDKDVYITSLVLGVLSISIFINSLMPLIMRVFYAIEETKLPLIVSIFGVITNIVLGILFSNLFGYTAVVNSLKHIIWYFDFTLFLKLLPKFPHMMFHLARGKYSIVGLAFGMSLGLVPEFLLSLYFIHKKLPQLFKKEFFVQVCELAIVLFMSGIIGFILYRPVVLQGFFNTICASGNNFICSMSQLIVVGLISVVALVPIVVEYLRIKKKFK